HEELRAVSVLARVRHGQLAVAAKDRRLIKLIVKLKARAAGAVAVRIAALDNELRHHPMERQAIVKLALHQARNNAHGFWREIVEELKDHVAEAGYRHLQECAGPRRHRDELII